MNCTIRKAVPADCGRIRPLQEQIARLHYNGRPDLFQKTGRFYTQEAFQQLLEDPKHTVFIAEAKDGSVIGYAFAWVIAYRNHPTYQDFDTFYIDDICVLEAFRRQGIGRQLFHACKETARSLGCKNMDLGVWAFNKDAIAFYEHCGMRERIRRMEYSLEEML